MIWEKNVKMIEKHNLEADLGVHTYTMKVNQFADLVSLFYFQSLI
jgi:cathepsin K